MAQIGNFDASKIDPRQSFDPLPPGWYAAQAIESEVKETKDGAGRYLQITFELLENYHPEHKGRRVWDRLNKWNKNETTVAIAEQSLSGLCRSVGLITISDSEELHFKPVAIKLKVKQSTGYDPTNEVSAYDALSARFGVAAASSPTVPRGGGPAPAASKPAAAPPWAKK